MTLQNGNLTTMAIQKGVVAWLNVFKRTKPDGCQTGASVYYFKGTYLLYLADDSPNTKHLTLAPRLAKPSLQRVKCVAAQLWSSSGSRPSAQILTVQLFHSCLRSDGCPIQRNTVLNFMFYHGFCASANGREPTMRCHREINQ